MNHTSPRSRTWGRTLLRAASVLGAVGLTTALVSAPAQAAELAKISHLEVADDGTLQVLVSVPPGSKVNLKGVKASVSGVEAETTATPSNTQTAVERTTILAIDTSNSMGRNGRFAAAKDSALTFLETAPDDVRVGIVGFASEVETLLPPTTDRAAAEAVIADLSLTKRTRLYEGVLEAIEQAGDTGARTVVVLSDGADTSKTELTEVTSAIQASDVTVDVVSLDGGGDLEALQAMATAGQGEVIEADPEALRAAFTAEAEALSRQILVSVQVPDSVQTTQGTVAVSLPAGNQTLETQAFGTIRAATEPGGAVDAATGFTLPKAVLLPAVVAGAVGLGGLLLLLLVPRRTSTNPDDLVSRYTRAAAGKRAAEKKEAEVALVQANLAMEVLLNRNKSLEERIATRLEQAGSKLKPSEWMLVQLAIFVGATVLALLLGRGNVILVALFMVAGALLPWLWLGFRRNKRRKKFNSLLPDTLQLMAGSLQAGLSLAQSIDTIVREGNEPVAGEFRRVLVETRLGVDLEDALEGVTERFDSKDFGWVVMAIKIQRQVGGNLAELLHTVAATMREREYMRRQVAALAAEGKLSAWVLGGLPPIFLLYLVLVNRDYVWPMFTEPVGWLMLGVGAVILSVGVFWMSRIVKVEV